MSSGPRTVTLGDRAIEYTVRESPEATQPRIDVGIHAVTVVVPEGDAVDPEDMLREHAGWVLERKAKFDDYRAQVPDRAFEEGETFPYRGEPHELVVESRSASDVGEGAMRLAAHHVEQTSVEQALERLYRRKAREHVEAAVDRYAAEMGVEYDGPEIRNQRTKWGSCSSSGTLGINWRLVMAPPDVLEYVVVHELAHLEEPNHTDEFWALVAEYDPDYREHADWLDEHSAELVFSEADL